MHNGVILMKKTLSLFFLIAFIAILLNWQLRMIKSHDFITIGLDLLSLPILTAIWILRKGGKNLLLLTMLSITVACGSTAILWFIESGFGPTVTKFGDPRLFFVMGYYSIIRGGWLLPPFAVFLWRFSKFKSDFGVAAKSLK
jgi:hypothetical protein